MFPKAALTHFAEPHNVGALAAPDAVGEAENEACGDTLVLHLGLEGDTVRDARFRSYGCSGAIAAGSALTTLIQGRRLSELAAVDGVAIDAALGGLPPLKLHAVVLAADALRAALEDASRRRDAGG